MQFKRIKPPKFYIGRNVLNEYELFQIMVEVAQGSRAGGIIVRDASGHKTAIRDDGRLMGTLANFNTQSEMHLSIIGENAERKERERKRRKLKRIQPPRYYWDGLILNEYEVRCLQVEVASGKRKPNTIELRDEKGTYFTITEDGTFNKSAYGFDINSGFTLELIRIRREKSKAGQSTSE